MLELDICGGKIKHGYKECVCKLSCGKTARCPKPNGKMILIAEWLNSNVTLNMYETEFKVGDTGELRLYIEPTVDQPTLNLFNSGIEQIDMVQGQGVIIMHFKKIGPFSAISAMSMGITGTIVGWQLFKNAVDLSPIVYFVVGVLGYVLVDKLLFKGKRQ